MGEVTQLLEDLVEEPLHLSQAVALGTRQVAGDLIQRDVNGHEQLRRFLVERMRDPAGDLLQPVVEAVQRLLRQLSLGDVLKGGAEAGDPLCLASKNPNLDE